MINYKFYCVQPIHINDEDLTKLFNVNTNLDTINPYIAEDKPSWMDSFNNELYYFTYVIKNFKEIDKNILKNELRNNFLVNNQYSLSEYLVLEGTTYYLLFDFRLMYFVLVYEIEFQIPINMNDELIACYKNNTDLYNCVRNILVKENENSFESRWVNEIKQNIVIDIAKVIEVGFNYKIDKNTITIENNTGNISNITLFHNDIEENKREEIANKLINLNNIAERLKSSKKPLLLSENNHSYNFYHFNGRFHTIILNDECDRFRYIPIQFHMQYMWFYLKKINFILEKQYTLIMSNNSLKNLEKHTIIIDELINKIEILILNNEKFKLIIEIDNEKIYSKIQSTWNIENTLSTSNKYINFFKDYLTRIYNKKSSKIEQRQNQILMYISIFQFVALISVWNDYLALLDTKLVSKVDKIIHIFGNNYNFEMFNYYLPVGFGLSIVLMIFYIYYNKKQ